MNLIFFIIASVLGFVAGYFSHDVIDRSFNLSEEKGRILLMLVITVAFVISFLYSLVNPLYQVPAPIYGLLAAVVGYFMYRKGGDK